jgi:tetratricopeptide (TPR) repeat protein
VQATLETTVGWLSAELGQYDSALAHCQRGLGLQRESGHRTGVGDALSITGKVYARRGDHADAKSYFLQAIDVFRDYGAAFDEATTLVDLGATLAAEGNLADAKDAWLSAQDILDRLAHPLADDVRVKLAALGTDEPAVVDPVFGPELARHDQGSPSRPLGLD